MKLNITGAVALLLVVNTAVAQTCDPDVTKTAPASEFSVNGDGTVTHNETGLMWMQCSLGQTWDSGGCTGGSTTYSWADALSAAESTTFATHSDWRLPNIKEMRSIVEYACFSPAIDLTVFPNTPTSSQNYVYWSSSPYANSSDSAWILGFDNGGDRSSSKGSSYSVRLVRGQ